MTLLYADTSALFKRYVEEDESEAVLARMEEASTVGTVLITRVEVAAALAMAVRAQRMDQDEAHEAEREFLDDWGDFTRIGVTDALTARAGGLAWQGVCRVRLVRGCFRRRGSARLLTLNGGGREQAHGNHGCGCEAVASTDGIDSPVGSRSRSGERQGNRDRTIDSKSLFVNNL